MRLLLTASPDRSFLRISAGPFCPEIVVSHWLQSAKPQFVLVEGLCSSYVSSSGRVAIYAVSRRELA